MNIFWEFFENFFEKVFPPPKKILATPMAAVGGCWRQLAVFTWARYKCWPENARLSLYLINYHTFFLYLGYLINFWARIFAQMRLGIWWLTCQLLWKKRHKTIFTVANKYYAVVTSGSRILVRWNQLVTARKVLPQGVAWGLQSPAGVQGQRPWWGLGRSPQKLPKFT